MKFLIIAGLVLLVLLIAWKLGADAAADATELLIDADLFD